MTGLAVPITPRSKQYGFIFWSKASEEEVTKFFKNAEKVDVWFQNSYLGTKRIDWKYRRISLGWKRTRALPNEVKYFRITYKKDKSIQVICE